MKVVVKGIKANVDVAVNVGFELEELSLDIEREDYEGLKELEKAEKATQETHERNRNVREFMSNGGVTDEIKKVIGSEIARQIKESFEK